MIFDNLKRLLLATVNRLPLGRFGIRPAVVGVLRLEGVIGRAGPGRAGMTLESHEKAIERLFATKRLTVAAIAVNSPGGSPVQSALLAKRIRDLAAEKNVPVVAFCEDVAASGGYWLACAGDEIYVDANSILGSIGVISAGFGFKGLIERFGVERRVYATGPRKGMLDPFQEEKPEDIERLRELHADIFANFREYVRSRRGDRLRAADDVLFTGDIWTGTEAVENGLADGIADLRGEMRRRYGPKVQFRKTEVRRGLLSRLRSGTGETSATGALDPAAIIAALDEWAAWKRVGL